MYTKRSIRRRLSGSNRWRIPILLMMALLVAPASAQQEYRSTAGASISGHAVDMLSIDDAHGTDAFTADIKITFADLPNLDRHGWKLLRTQVLKDLKSEEMVIRIDAIGLLVNSVQQFPGRADFRAATPSLLNMFRHGSQGEKLGAVAGLHAINDSGAMKELMRLAQFEKSANVKRVAEFAVADHYGMIRNDE